MFTLARRLRFDASHFLPLVPEGHKCRHVHGHGFEVEILVRGEVDPELGWVIDYADLDRAARAVVDPLDHAFLNAIPGLENPTSELLAAWIWARLQPSLPGLYRITIYETPQSRCEYEGPA